MPFSTVLFYVGYPCAIAFAAALLVGRNDKANATSNLA
jgi:hypothetical protein